ncbi:MAG: sugar phosphate nucleotidyltransferase [Candidatus Micrarchaeota archaeon]|nr:sugar phosphate nucleotidyltransferase [Candidatus Micrarchaeota archaeon]
MKMKAVVLAAGEGKRLRPLTYTRPKCMIQIAGKPILQHVLESIRGAGVKEAVIVVKYMEDVVKEHFGNGKKIGMKLHYVTQGSKYGTGAAFLTAEDEIDDTFFGMAGDVIVESQAVKSVIDAHSSGITVGLKKVKDTEQYGIAKVEGGVIKNFVEKPRNLKSGLANTSMYVFNGGVFAKLKALRPSPRGEIEVTNLIKSEMKMGKVRGVEIGGYWLDMGMPWHLFNANEYLLKKLAPKRGNIENSRVIGKVIMEKGARIFDSRVEGPVYIGAGTTVGPHAYIRPCTSIGAGCDISDSTTVKNSISFDRVNAKHLTYIGDSIIGYDCNFGAGTQIANFRFDEGQIRTYVNGSVMNTKRRKLGAIIGDNTKTGVLSCIMPGILIGDDCWIGSGVVVNENIPRKTRVFVKQQLEFKSSQE